MPSFHLTRLLDSTRRPLQNSDLYSAIGNPCLQDWPISFCRRLIGLQSRADPPQPAAEDAVRRRWRRRGEAPAAACVVAARARGRRASDACMLPGELGAGVLRASQLARVRGARVRPICTAGRAVVPIASSSCAVCERVGVSRARRKDIKFDAKCAWQSPCCYINSVAIRCVSYGMSKARSEHTINVPKRRLGGGAGRPPRRRIVSPPWRTRRPIGPIATELSQPCGQADWIHHRHTQSHIYSRYEINKARICSADRPKCTSAGARPHTGKPSIPTPRRLHKATDYGTHPGGSRGR